MEFKEFKRSDANQIALKAVSTILNAAKDCTLKVAGKEVKVAVTPQEAKWPEPLPGLDENKDGPWPHSRRVVCTWEEGSVAFQLEASYWSSKHKRYCGQVGLLLRCTLPNNAKQQVVWCTFASPIDQVKGEGQCQLRANIALNKRKTVEDSTQRSYAVRALVDKDKLKRGTPYGVEIGTLKVPDASFMEPTEKSFQRLIHLALLKLPFLLASGAKIGEGKWLFVRDAVLKDAKPPVDEKDPPKPDEPEPEGESDDDTSTDKTAGAGAEPIPCTPHNIILYGPPGTGKTWKTVEKALELIESGWKDKPREEQVQRYRTLLNEGRIALVTFHQSYGYEEFVEGIRPVLDDGGGKDVRYTLQEGAFKSIALRAAAAGVMAASSEKSSTPITPSPERAQAALDGKSGETFVFTPETPQFVLIIDEINRGNISKILGELITLLEADKRLTGADETRLRLSNSHGHQFAVPPNLHVIGTMNTADRSIALMDVALRRRFDFEELMPSSAVLKAELAKDPKATEAHVQLVVEIFEALNKRIVWLYDRDHQIGHAYFLKATTLDALRKVFVDRVIPLLQEYFYGAWEKITIVLGCPYDDNGNPLRKKSPVVDETQKSHSYRAPLIVVERSKVAEELGLTEDMDDGRLQFGINDAFRSSSGAELVPYFLSILALDHAQWKAREAALLASVEPASQGAGG